MLTNTLIYVGGLNNIKMLNVIIYVWIWKVSANVLNIRFLKEIQFKNSIKLEHKYCVKIL